MDTPTLTFPKAQILQIACRVESPPPTWPPSNCSVPNTELRGHFRPLATKVVIATAADDKDTIDQALRELCDAYIVKPIDTGEIIDIVHCLFPLESTNPLNHRFALFQW
jgi:CheY-like chemotaxis protein